MPLAPANRPKRLSKLWFSSIISTTWRMGGVVGPKEVICTLLATAEEPGPCGVIAEAVPGHANPGQTRPGQTCPGQTRPRQTRPAKPVPAKTVAARTAPTKPLAAERTTTNLGSRRPP